MAVPATGIAVEGLDSKVTTVTVVFSKDGFYDSETAVIHRERKSVESMDEIYGIFPVGSQLSSLYDGSDLVDATKWGTTIAEAIDKNAVVGSLVELDDKGQELWNAMQITYTDDTLGYTDFTNLGNGIRNVVEYYCITNPGLVVTADNIDASVLRPTTPVVNGGDANTELAKITASTDPKWTVVKPDLVAKYDCLWNFEFIVTEDNKCRATAVSLINQLVHGDSPFALIIDNQYPNIACDSFNKVITTDNSNIFYSKATLRSGSEDLTDVIYKVAPYKVSLLHNGQTREFYCIGETAEGYRFENKDRSLYLHIDKASMFTSPAIKNGKFYSVADPSVNYADYNNVVYSRLTIDAATGAISSTAAYIPEVVDCYSYVQATYGPAALTFVNSLVTHNISKGAAGIPYNFRGEWQPNVDYYCNEDAIDLVYVVQPDGKSKIYYICKETHTSKDTFTADSSYWKQFDGNYSNLATGLLLAEEAVIDKLKVNAADVLGKLTADQIDANILNSHELHVFNDSGDEVVTIDNVDISDQVRYVRAPMTPGEVAGMAQTSNPSEASWVTLASNEILGTITVTAEAGATTKIVTPRMSCAWEVVNYTNSSATSSPKIVVELVNAAGTRVGDPLDEHLGTPEACPCSASGKLTSSSHVIPSKEIEVTPGVYKIRVNAQANVSGGNLLGKSHALLKVRAQEDAMVKYSKAGEGVVIGRNGISVKKGDEAVSIKIEDDGIKTTGLVRTEANGVTNIKIIHSESEAGLDPSDGTLYILIP